MLTLIDICRFPRLFQVLEWKPDHTAASTIPRQHPTRPHPPTPQDINNFKCKRCLAL